MLGLGTVGAAVARRLINEWDLLGERAGATPVLRCVAVRDLSRSRDLELKNVRLLADAFDSLSESVDKISRFGLAADCHANGLDTLKDLL